MNNSEARDRLAHAQGTLMKLIANIETCRLMLIGADAPDITMEVSLTVFTLQGLLEEIDADN